MYLCVWPKKHKKIIIAMSGFYILYHSLIFSALILALYSYRKTGENIYVASLLIITLITELLAEVLIKLQFEFVWAYHIYTPLNYTFLALHFHQHIKNEKVKKAIIYSIVGFCLFCLGMSALFYRFKEFPGLCITVDGCLIILICIYYLFNINPDSEQEFFKRSNRIEACAFEWWKFSKRISIKKTTQTA